MQIHNAEIGHVAKRSPSGRTKSVPAWGAGGTVVSGFNPHIFNRPYGTLFGDDARSQD